MDEGNDENISNDTPLVLNAATTAGQAEAMAEVLAAATNRAASAREQAVMGVAQDDMNMIAPLEAVDESGELVKQRFLDFLASFKQEIQSDEEDDVQGGSTIIYPYAEQATQMARRQLARRSIQAQQDSSADGSLSSFVFSNTLFLDFTHVMQEDMELAEAIQTDFVRFEPYLRAAIQSFVLELHPELDQEGNNVLQQQLQQSYFIAIHNLPTLLTVRELRTDRIGRLTAVSGTLTRTTDVRPELLMAAFRCNKCGLIASGIRQQYHYTRPVTCRNPRCANDSPLQFTLETAASEMCDWQKVRVQENSDEIPPGSMPRSIDVVVRNEMVERAKAGDKCIFIGSLVVIPDGSALARAGEAPLATRSGNTNANNDGNGVKGLRGLGVRELTYRTCFVATTVLPADARHAGMTALLFGQQTLENHEPSAEEVVMELSRVEREDIRKMKSNPRLYEDMVDSIAPDTFGHREVKKGILLMLLGGVHKTTADGIKLRGDINVCIVGDPSTAKSQFLKYVHAFLPSRAVYTSGKASSAAGLTAAVQRDQDTGEYCIEAGALMLADNGICCIDEFDKMDPTDQVAIHEAMEQQTISITKAGIQATLNARASILAAANPIYGRYDRTKTLKANVALSAPILSRFDLFFVVLDECNPDSDRQVAQHILKVHRCQEEAVRPPYTKEQMQRYIRFARTIQPKITESCQRVFVDCYRKLRQGDTLGRSRSAYRITVRQLESMIRLSEALARLHCDQEIQPTYVREAFRLLKTSIIQVETSDVDVEDEDDHDDRGEDNNAPGNDDGGHEMSQDKEPETQVRHPGEYDPSSEDVDHSNAADTAMQEDEKPKKQRTKISFAEYEAMTNAIATHLRSLERDDVDDEEENSGTYLKWSQVVEWYLEQVEQEIGDSLERLGEIRKKVNLVLRRLVNVDLVLVTIGEPPKSKREEQETLLKVHPNYVIS